MREAPASTRARSGASKRPAASAAAARAASSRSAPPRTRRSRSVSSVRRGALEPAAATCLVRLGGDRRQPLGLGRQLAGVALDLLAVVLGNLEEPDLTVRAEADALQLGRGSSLVRTRRRLLRLELVRTDSRQLGGNTGGALGVRPRPFAQRRLEPRRDRDSGEERLVEPVGSTRRLDGARRDPSRAPRADARPARTRPRLLSPGRQWLRPPRAAARACSCSASTSPASSRRRDFSSSSTASAASPANQSSPRCGSKPKPSSVTDGVVADSKSSSATTGSSATRSAGALPIRTARLPSPASRARVSSASAAGASSATTADARHASAAATARSRPGSTSTSESASSAPSSASARAAGGMPSRSASDRSSAASRSLASAARATRSSRACAPARAAVRRLVRGRLELGRRRPGPPRAASASASSAPIRSRKPVTDSARMAIRSRAVPSRCSTALSRPPAASASSASSPRRSVRSVSSRSSARAAAFARAPRAAPARRGPLGRRPCGRAGASRRGRRPLELRARPSLVDAARELRRAGPRAARRLPPGEARSARSRPGAGRAP